MSILNDKQGIQPELREVFKNISIDEAIELPMSAEADLNGGATLGDTIAKVNALLAKMRSAGLLGV